jgi:hypothetical protein
MITMPLWMLYMILGAVVALSIITCILNRWLIITRRMLECLQSLSLRRSDTIPITSIADDAPSMAANITTNNLPAGISVKCGNPTARNTTMGVSIADIIKPVYFLGFSIMRVYKRLKRASINKEKNHSKGDNFLS